MQTLIGCNACKCINEKTPDSTSYCEECGSADVKEFEGINGKNSARVVIIGGGGISAAELELRQEVLARNGDIPIIAEPHRVKDPEIKEELEFVIERFNTDDIDDMMEHVKRSRTKQHKDLMRKGRREFHKKGR